jgi:hypothetical protein
MMSDQRAARATQISILVPLGYHARWGISQLGGTPLSLEGACICSLYS